MGEKIINENFEKSNSKDYIEVEDKPKIDPPAQKPKSYGQSNELINFLRDNLLHNPNKPVEK